MSGDIPGPTPDEELPQDASLLEAQRHFEDAAQQHENAHSEAEAEQIEEVADEAGEAAVAHRVDVQHVSDDDTAVDVRTEDQKILDPAYVVEKRNELFESRPDQGASHTAWKEWDQKRDDFDRLESKNYRMKSGLERLEKAGRVNVVTDGLDRPPLNPDRLSNADLDPEARRLAGAAAGVEKDDWLEQRKSPGVHTGKESYTANFKYRIDRARRSAVGLYERDPARYQNMPASEFVQQLKTYETEMQDMQHFEKYRDQLLGTIGKFEEIDLGTVDSPTEAKKIVSNPLYAVMTGFGVKFESNAQHVRDPSGVDETQMAEWIRDLIGDERILPVGRTDSAKQLQEFKARAQVDAPGWARKYAEENVLGDMDKPMRQQIKEFGERLQLLKTRMAEFEAQRETEFQKKWGPEVPEEQLVRAAGISVPAYERDEGEDLKFRMGSS